MWHIRRIHLRCGRVATHLWEVKMIQALQCARFWDTNPLAMWTRRSRERDPLEGTVLRVFHLIRNYSARESWYFSQHLEDMSHDQLVHLRHRIDSLSDELNMQRWYREDRRSLQEPRQSLDHRRAFGKLSATSSGNFPYLYEVVHLWSATFFLWCLRFKPCQDPAAKFCHVDFLNDNLPLAYISMTVLTGLSVHTARLKWNRYQYLRNLENHVTHCSLVANLVDGALENVHRSRVKRLSPRSKSRLMRITH